MEDRINHLISIGEAILQVLQNMEQREEIPLNRSQAASYLGVSVSTISNYEKKGLRKSVKNGMAGYLPSDLNRFKK